MGALPAADPQLLLAAKPYINTGAAAGPVHGAFGDLVSTANGLRSLALEGFSEDVNQDGFVDPGCGCCSCCHLCCRPCGPPCSFSCYFLHRLPSLRPPPSSSCCPCCRSS